MTGALGSHNPKETLWRGDYDRILAALETGNCVLQGDSKIGKTAALRAVATKRDKVLFLPLKLAGTSPEHFALDVASMLLAQNDWEHYANYRGIGNLLRHGTKQPPGLAAAIHTIDNELQKIKPDQRLLVETALSVPGILSQKKITVIIDDADSMLALANYGALKDPFSCIKQQPNVTWLLSTTLPLPIKGFQHIVLSPFSFTEIKELLSPYSLDDASLSQLHKYTIGMPSLGISFAKGYDQKRSVKRHYIHQLLSPSSDLHQYAKEELTSLLGNARGATLLEVVLRILAEHGPLTLSDIARKLYRPAPVTQSILLRLLEVGLIQRDGRLYSIKSGILRDFILLDVLGFSGQAITTQLLRPAEGRV